MKKLIALALLAASFAANALDFKGVEIGGKYTYQEIKEKLQIYCYPSNSCGGSQTIGGVNAHVLVMFEDDRETVKNIQLRFKPEYFDDVSSVVSGKYKKPKVATSKVGTIYGQLSNVELTWKNSGCEIYAEKYVKANESMIVYYCFDVTKYKEQKEKNKSDI